MDILYSCCAGLDLHKDSVVVCVRRLGKDGRCHKEVRTFGTVTRDLLSLSDWLADEGVTHAAMESTGVYWKPVFNILEGRFELLLVNAQHMKQVPGRKTDVKDCEWIAQLLQCGLLKASFIPPQPIRELRELTRQRTQLIGERSAVVNRIQKVLEDANIKLGSVASEVLGVSGRAMLEAMIAGEQDPVKLADLARKRLRAKIPELQLALRGRVTDHHRFLLRLFLEQVDHLENLMGQLSSRIEMVMASVKEAATRLDTIPGVDRHMAEILVAELGTDMSRFPTEGHLCSWAGMCPGNNESAGKRRTGKTTRGSRWLRTGLVQAAWAASHTKNTYLSAQYRRLAARRGKRRALVAVGHTILVIVYQLLKKGTNYEELGGDYFDRLGPERLTRNLVRRLEKLGHKVTLEKNEEAA
jgi:transposase